MLEGVRGLWVRVWGAVGLSMEPGGTWWGAEADRKGSLLQVAGASLRLRVGLGPPSQARDAVSRCGAGGCRHMGQERTRILRARGVGSRGLERLH